MQIKIGWKPHFTPVRMAIIKKRNDDTCWQECGERETSSHWGERTMLQVLWETEKSSKHEK